jgi:hypothetical protein
VRARARRLGSTGAPHPTARLCRSPLPSSRQSDPQAKGRVRRQAMAMARRNEGTTSPHETTASRQTLRLGSVQAEAACPVEVYPLRSGDSKVVLSSVVTIGTHTARAIPNVPTM